MDEEYPGQAEQESQEMNAERTGARGPAAGDTSPPAAELAGTGDDRVDAAVAGLSRLAGSPAEEHVAVLEEVHGGLRDILGQLNEQADRPDGAQGAP